MFNLNNEVEFDFEDEHGNITGTQRGKIVGFFKNGKAKVECRIHWSGELCKIRKAIYNIPLTELRKVPANPA